MAPPSLKAMLAQEQRRRRFAWIILLSVAVGGVVLAVLLYPAAVGVHYAGLDYEAARQSLILRSRLPPGGEDYHLFTSSRGTWAVATIDERQLKDWLTSQGATVDELTLPMPVRSLGKREAWIIEHGWRAVLEDSAPHWYWYDSDRNLVYVVSTGRPRSAAAR